MRAIQHHSNNCVLAPPHGSSMEECTALAVTRLRYQANPDQEHVRSYWAPSAEERAAIAAGAKVVLQMEGSTHAPAYVGVEAEGLLLVGEQPASGEG